ncbi:hypothetical protein A0H81_00592 [Grifola frondosa]|uniref:Uncharacterized protein n=1 Tax=Grifola frondosa TaxID=5627 RepID=A0A1C7MPH6_GRIFR|nr:hypothetical protein A0H81_00592 [Grifola frondosa]
MTLHLYLPSPPGQPLLEEMSASHCVVLKKDANRSRPVAAVALFIAFAATVSGHHDSPVTDVAPASYEEKAGAPRLHFRLRGYPDENDDPRRPGGMEDQQSGPDVKPPVNHDAGEGGPKHFEGHPKSSLDGGISQSGNVGSDDSDVRSDDAESASGPSLISHGGTSESDKSAGGSTISGQAPDYGSTTKREMHGIHARRSTHTDKLIARYPAGPDTYVPRDSFFPFSGDGNSHDDNSNHNGADGRSTRGSAVNGSGRNGGHAHAGTTGDTEGGKVINEPYE